MRTRAQNTMGGRLAGHLDAFEPVLTERAAPVPELVPFVDEGRALRERLAALIHGDLERRQFDKKALLSWIERTEEIHNELIAADPGPTWEPPGPDTIDARQIAATGRRVPGVVVSVEKSGWGNERVASLEVSIGIDIDGRSRTISRRISIPVTRAPRVGDQVDVAFDRADPNRFVYRPRLEWPANGNGGEEQIT